MYNLLINFNNYIEDYDRKIVFINIKRALLYITSKCISLIDEENIEVGDIIKLDSRNPYSNFFLVLNSKHEYTNYEAKDSDDKYYLYNYSLYHKFDNEYPPRNLNSSKYKNSMELLEFTCTDINNLINFEFKVIPNVYDNFTDYHQFLINYIFNEYINNTLDDDTPYDLFHSLIVEDNEDDKNDS